MSKIRLGKKDPPLFYVGLDGTNAVDTVVWGHLWNSKFGWKNLLWALDKDPADSQRRVDPANPKLPILRQVFTRKKTKFADTFIAPEGKDGKGLDPAWTSQSDPLKNVPDMNRIFTFTRKFILAPGVKNKRLNSSATGSFASVVFISCHGSQLGDMFGETSYHTTGADYLFSLVEAATAGQPFNGPDWLVLSNCYTLIDLTFNDWLPLMKGPKPLRGILGFQLTCPLPEPSARIFSGFVDGLAKGKTVKDAFADSCTALGVAKNWIVLCHKNAENDVISDWNARKLKPVKPATSTISFFNDANPSGKLVTLKPDPFEVFWSKVVTTGSPAVRVTAANRSDPANKIAPKDEVSITVKLAPPATKFAAGDKVTVTLIYIRENYLQAIDVRTMFKIKGQTGAGAPITAKLNTSRPSAALGSKDGHDSWVLTVSGTPAQVELRLECVDLDLSGKGQHNVPYWLRVEIAPAGGGKATSFDFTRNGAVLLQ
ncbi:MAG: hypothetical protein ABUT39_19330 [Acidobacteriota bacterium]